MATDNPFVKPIRDVRLVNTKPKEGGWQIVVLGRVEPGVSPPYCVHGKVPCDKCQDWCWLGEKTYELMLTGDYLPLCIECATEVGVHTHGKRIGNAGDGFHS